MRKDGTYVRNFVFGVEDSLVSTVGLLSGIAIAGVASSTILLTGTVLIFVEAFSMAAGSFLSEVSVEEYEAPKKRHSRSVLGGAIMFGSYFVAGFIPLFPYVLGTPERALAYSISLSIIALFILGAWSGAMSSKGLFRGAIRMAIIGGMAIAVGVVVGSYLST